MARGPAGLVDYLSDLVGIGNFALKVVQKDQCENSSGVDDVLEPLRCAEREDSRHGVRSRE